MAKTRNQFKHFARKSVKMAREGDERTILRRIFGRQVTRITGAFKWFNGVFWY
jgi:hypothetical protein